MRIPKLLALIILIILVVNSSLVLSSITVSENPFYKVNPRSIIIAIYTLYSLPILIGMIILITLIMNWRKIVEFIKGLLEIKLDFGEGRGRSPIYTFISFIIFMLTLYVFIRIYKGEVGETLENGSVDQTVNYKPAILEVGDMEIAQNFMPIILAIYSIITIVLILIVIYALYRYKQGSLLQDYVSTSKIKKIFRQAIKRIRTGDPIRDVIIDTYLKLIEVMEELGFRPYPQETPREYERRIITYLQLPEEHLSQLTALFEEAKYSNHILSEDMANIAINALYSIGRHLKIEGEI